MISVDKNVLKLILVCEILIEENKSRGDSLHEVKYFKLFSLLVSSSS